MDVFFEMLKDKYKKIKEFRMMLFNVFIGLIFFWLTLTVINILQRNWTIVNINWSNYLQYYRSFPNLEYGEYVQIIISVQIHSITLIACLVGYFAL